MIAYLKITITTFTIWILTCLINALLYGTSISFLNHQREGLVVTTIFVFILSLFFSAPGFLIFWIALLVNVARNIYGRALFRAALSAGFMLAAATAIICSGFLSSVIPTNKYVFVLSVLLSSNAGIMLHFKNFKKINNQAL